MGWTYSHKDSNVSAKEFLQKEFDGRIVDVAIKNLRTAYCAYKSGNNVIGMVVLLNYAPNDYFNFGYKEITESMGPFHYDCPEKILKQLTPIEQLEGEISNYCIQEMKEWRNKCWQAIEQRKLSNSIYSSEYIKFDKILNFTDGYSNDTFQIVKEGRKTYFRSQNGKLYNISGWRNMKYSKITSDEFQSSLCVI